MWKVPASGQDGSIVPQTGGFVHTREARIAWRLRSAWSRNRGAGVMRARELRQALESEAVLDEFEERDYLGMSRIWACPRALYREVVEGRAAPELRAARLFHEGYLHEGDVLARFAKAGIAVTQQGQEVVAPFDERFRGHIDGALDGALLEVKSVTRQRFERIMDSKWPRRHLDQCEMYMRYGWFARCLIVYKCREDGDLWVVEITPDVARADALEEKAKRVLASVDAGRAPDCTCGKCR